MLSIWVSLNILSSGRRSGVCFFSWNIFLDVTDHCGVNEYHVPSPKIKDSFVKYSSNKTGAVTGENIKKENIL